MKRLKRVLKILGPGLITGAADDDPSGIATYSQAGARFGYDQAWTALFAFPLMTIVQEMSARIGMVTGQGLAGVIKGHYQKGILFFITFCLLIVNIINIGADIGAMAASTKLILDIPFTPLVVWMVLISLLLVIFVPYRTYVKVLKFLSFSLVTYIMAAFFIKLDWINILFHTLIPTIRFDNIFLMTLVAVFGTTLSPYLFFWQAAEEVEEEVKNGRVRLEERKGATRSEIQQMRTDVTLGMFFSNLIMFFIIVMAGSTLFRNGIHNIETADQAALALRPLVGDFAFFFFALGILSTGFLALPVLAGSAAYALSEVLGWRWGLSRQLWEAPGFYGIMILATVVGLLINFIGINPIKALFYTAVLNGIIAIPILIIILLICNNKRVMGEFVNQRPSNLLGIILLLFMIFTVLGMIWL